MCDTIVIAGSLAQKPGHGGHTWVFLQYLLGLRRLGWKVLFIDALEPAVCVGDDGRACARDPSLNLAFLRRVMARFDLGHSFALIYNHGERVVGLSRSQLLERVKNSACLINVMGFLNDEEILAAAPRRVFLDIDPGFGQMWQALGLVKMFRGHDDYVTIGQNIGQPGCLIPTCGIRWITTAPPVVLDYWPQQPPVRDGCFTSVMSWRGAYGPLEYQGKRF